MTREGKWLAQGHTVSQWKSRGLTPDFLAVLPPPAVSSGCRLLGDISHTTPPAAVFFRASVLEPEGTVEIKYRKKDRSIYPMQRDVGTLILKACTSESNFSSECCFRGRTVSKSLSISYTQGCCGTGVSWLSCIPYFHLSFFLHDFNGCMLSVALKCILHMCLLCLYLATLALPGITLRMYSIPRCHEDITSMRDWNIRQ